MNETNEAELKPVRAWAMLTEKGSIDFSCHFYEEYPNAEETSDTTGWIELEIRPWNTRHQAPSDIKSVPLTPDERKSVNEFFLSQIKAPSGVEEADLKYCRKCGQPVIREKVDFEKLQDACDSARDRVGTMSPEDKKVLEDKARSIIMNARHKPTAEESSVVRESVVKESLIAEFTRKLHALNAINQAVDEENGRLEDEIAALNAKLEVAKTALKIYAEQTTYPEYGSSIAREALAKMEK